MYYVYVEEFKEESEGVNKSFIGFDGNSTYSMRHAKPFTTWIEAHWAAKAAGANCYTILSTKA